MAHPRMKCLLAYLLLGCLIILLSGCMRTLMKNEESITIQHAPSKLRLHFKKPTVTADPLIKFLS